MKRVFADTFFFLAVLNRRDPAHEAALRFFGDDQLLFVTSEWVIAEVANASSGSALRSGFKLLFELLMKDRRVRIVEASHSSFRGGLDLYFRRPDKDWSFTDCCSIELMREEQIEQVLTGDHHFVQAGFKLLLGSQIE